MQACFPQVDAETLELAVQVGALHAHGRGDVADIAAGELEVVFEIGLFEVVARFAQWQIEERRGNGFHGNRRFLRAERRRHIGLGHFFALRQDQQALHQILELADVARPGVVAQHIERAGGEAPVGQAFLFHHPVHVETDQLRHVFAVFTQGRE